MSSLASQSRKHYKRVYRLVALSVILMTAVLTGSLSLGDSVRGTLVRRVSERLGNTETVITSGTGFLDEALTDHPLLNQARGYLLTDGFVSVGEKLIPVYVWGTDDDSLKPGEVMLSPHLSALISKPSTLNSKLSTLTLHLPSHNLIPSGSLFVTKSYATTMRVDVVGVKNVDEGGNLLLRNEQTLPLNVFIDRRCLAEQMELEGKINLVLADNNISNEQLAACWTPETSGIHVTDSSLTCDGVFIAQAIVDNLSTSTPSHRYFSYFVNSLASERDTIPYSFVTAVEEWQGERLDGQDVILADYAAARLNVTVGDSIGMEYFVTKRLKTLDTRHRMLRVKRIVPLASLGSDSLLMAEFPGLTHVESCTDWDSDLPIDMNRVLKEDEDYWYAHRQTPKAIVSYEAVGADWSNSFGCATALRFASRPDVGLSPGDAGVILNHPRAQGVKGATGGVDFAGLFLALGFFIILAAILLMQHTLAGMFAQRGGEIALYQQLGFSTRKIGFDLFRESFGVMLIASPLGAVAGVAYSGLTLWLLGNVWSGATHTEGFALQIEPLTLLVGTLGGLFLCALVLWQVLRSQLKQGASSLNSNPATPNSQPSTLNSRLSTLNSRLSTLLFLLTAILIVLNFIWLHNMVLFIIGGLLWILLGGIFLNQYMERKISDSTPFNRKNMTWLSVGASRKHHLLAYWALSLGVFAVFAVGLNRPDFSRAVQATGGYQFYIDSRVPIQYDLNNRSVRQKLSLQSLPDSTRFLAFMRHTEDEASCLNLNQVSTPTVLGVDLGCMESFGLTPSTLSNSSTLPQLYIDQEALLWSLKKTVGDTLIYLDETGKNVSVLIAGSYPTGIFHGNAIMSDDDFRRLWPKETGVEVLLMTSSHPDEAAEILSTAMNEYGLSIQTAEERIRMFFEVTETYLIIFLTLGGLGLLLGIFSLMIVVRRNLTAQATTIGQYRAMGFREDLIRQLLLRENLIVPLYAVAVGAIGSVISISANVGGAGPVTLLLGLVVLAAIGFLLCFGIKYMISQSIWQLTINN